MAKLNKVKSDNILDALLGDLDGSKLKYEEEQAFIIRSDNPAGVLADLTKLDSLCGYTILPGEILELEDVFFDTPDRAIRGSKSSLRVRTSTNEMGETTTLVCMKGKNTSKSGSSVRTENEFPWPYENPSPFDIADLFGLEELQRRRTTRIARTIINPTFKKPHKQIRAELALDCVSYLNDDGDVFAKFYEVEIEMKSDVSVGLKALTSSLKTKFPELETWSISKFGMGNVLDLALQIQLDDKGVLSSESFNAIYSLVG